jgi:hypothetical protein
MNTQTKPQLHVSYLNTLATCGIQFQRRYGNRYGCWHEEEIIPPGVALVTGISVHKSVETNLRNKIATGALLPREQVREVASIEFTALHAGGMSFTEEEAADVNKTLGEALDQTVALATLHYDCLAPSLKPLQVEKTFVIVLEGYPFDLGGQIDIVEPNAIRDTKTSGKSPSQDSTHSMQMAMYALGIQVETGKLPERVCLDYLVKTKVPKLVLLEEKPERSWIAPLLRRVERATEVIEAVKSGKQAFMPANPNDWCCTEKWCGYAKTCPYWSGR